MLFLLGESSFFETLLPDGETISIEIEDFDSVASFINKGKVSITDQFLLQKIGDDCAQALEPLGFLSIYLKELGYSQGFFTKKT